MSRTSTIVRKYPMLIHRWMGVAFCVLFLVWFASGIVMMYWGFPDVSEAERLARAEALDAVKEVELAFFAGEPFYLAVEAPLRSLVLGNLGQRNLGQPTGAPPREQLDAERVREAIARGVQPHALSEVRVVREYEAYYIDREYDLPLPALFVRLDDSERSMYYVNLRTGRRGSTPALAPDTWGHSSPPRITQRGSAAIRSFREPWGIARNGCGNGR